ncbi:MAG: PadR family transcriptional regulator [Salegentibacter sp.]
MNKEFLQKWQSQVKKGTLTFIVLNVLKDNEFYGYEFIEEVKKQTKIEIAEGTFYPLMTRLKKENLVASKWVEQESGIPRKYYTLTKTGRETLEDMKSYWEELASSIKKISK